MSNSIFDELSKYKELGNFDVCIDFLNKNKDSILDLNSLNLASFICVKQKKYELANTIIDHYIERNPNSVQAIRRKADIQHRMNDKENTLYWAKRYAAIENEPIGYIVLSEYLIKYNKPKEAIDILSRYQLDLSDEKLLQVYFSALLAIKDVEKIAKVLKSVSYTSLRDKRTKVLYLSALSLLGKGLDNILGLPYKDIANADRDILSVMLASKVTCNEQDEKNNGPIALENLFALGVPVVQYWDDYSKISTDVKNAIDMWRKVPGIKHYLYDRVKARTFILDNFGLQFLAGFDRALHPAQEADIFRLAFLFVYGGVYSDIDFLPNVNIKNLTIMSSKDVFFYYRDNLPPHQVELLNSFIIAKANSSFVFELLCKAIANTSSISKKGIWRDTGPGLVGETYLQSRYSFSVGVLSHNIVFKKCISHKSSWDYKELGGRWQSTDYIT